MIDDDLRDFFALLEPEKEGLSQDEPGGNTRSPGRHQLYKWQFTLKSTYKSPSRDDEPIEPESLAAVLSKYSKIFYFQLERGEGGYEHYQGCFSLCVKHRFNEIKNMIGFSNIHLEGIKNWNASVNYCQKMETRVKGPWSHASVWVKTIDILNWWQSEIEKTLLASSDDRSIYWVWDSTGNVGKTTFCKYMAVKHGATVLNNGSFSDLAFAIPENPKIILFDLPRTIEGRVNYSAIEACKNGMIFSGKYESRMKIFNPPHVAIFANFGPDLRAMSLDRWQVIDLG